jgi:hypothetical protein
VTRPPRWRATGPDGVAHAFVATLPTALCGAKNQPERFDWPYRIHCFVCEVREEETKGKRKAS